jgi:hypothetical protein
LQLLTLRVVTHTVYALAERPLRVAAKGRLWHFRVGASSPPDAFCNTGPVQIL